MKKLSCVIALSLVVLLAACGQSNPLIGKWEAEPIMGINSGEVEFKADSTVSTSMIGGMEQTHETKIDGYKVEKDRVGVIVTDPQNKQSATLWYRMKDPDTATLDTGIVTIVYHRKK
ncbi:MAG: hypothetical protein M0Z78_06620 [Betaproteobacteria bacterium]|nr:hypothetical protein [Betaproteobacteria bacterium]